MVEIYDAMTKGHNLEGLKSGLLRKMGEIPEEVRKYLDNNKPA